MELREVYVPLVKELYDCAVIVNRETIKSRENNKIINVTLKDVADTLNVSLDAGERYSPI